ncbi:hypothetical protein F6X40_36400 [Paraburkholderia sp. UCT31]|uniref:hypothetical protein n=1 Tax=Paraburkholderia sp. UCT31 TaxID=2615209 RepID=UPI001654F3B1|nr:hypothetical protein [Paraburkholderia sp. UCT31]MBC8742023.1 hypothetical protein [Paraburkholderia sp. UCT31]
MSQVQFAREQLTRSALLTRMVSESVQHVSQPGDDIASLTARYVEAYGRMDDAALVSEYKYQTGKRVALVAI